MVAIALAGGCTESATPLYGAPPPEDVGTLTDVGNTGDAGDDADPAVDAGDVDSSTVADTGSMPIPLYGGAPPEE